MTAIFTKEKFRYGFFAGLFIIFLLLSVYTEYYYLLLIPFAILLFDTGWKHINIVFYLLLFSLPFATEYNFSSSLGTDIPDEILMLYLSVLVVFNYIYAPSVIPRISWRHPVLFLLLFSLCWIVISVAFSTYPVISLKYLLAKCWYLGAFVLAPLMIFRDKKNIRFAAISLAAAMLLITVITLLRHSTHTFQFAEINQAITPFFRNHVTYSAMLVCILPLFFAFYSLSKPGRRRTIITILICLMLVALFFSYARGAWLALFAGWLCYWLIRKRLLLLTFVASIIILISSLFWVAQQDRYLHYTRDFNTTIFHKDFRQHLIATYKLKDVSTAERIYRWVAGIRMIKHNSVTGFGPNTFYNNYKEYTIPAFKTWVSRNDDHSTVHNYFLLLAIEQGIPGLVIFLLLLGTVLYYAQHLYHRVKDVFYKSVAITAGVMLTMIMVVNFLSDLIETDKIGSLFFLCLAGLVVTDINTRKEIIDNN